MAEPLYHVPVLAKESIVALDLKPNGVYVDVTFGGGGHTRLLLDALGEKARVFGFDQDGDARRNIPKDPRFTFVYANFRHIKRFLKLYGIREVDGVLADLGVSSHQFDVPERGFSHRFDATLDMRMNQGIEVKAADILNGYSAKELQRMLGELGEVRNAKTLALEILKWRKQKAILTVADFAVLMEPLVRGQRQRYFSQVYQALRMEVNDEVNALKDFLSDTVDLLKPKGRLAVLTYHSIEDRIVKRFFKNGNFEGVPEKDFYGNIITPFKMITRKPLIPNAAEIALNNRARSAKLRCVEKK